MPPYLQPMVDYIRTKENTGVYNSRRSVHMPVEVALQERCNERSDGQIFIYT